MTPEQAAAHALASLSIADNDEQADIHQPRVNGFCRCPVCDEVREDSKRYDDGGDDAE